MLCTSALLEGNDTIIIAASRKCNGVQGNLRVLRIVLCLLGVDCVNLFSSYTMAGSSSVILVVSCTAATRDSSSLV